MSSQAAVDLPKDAWVRLLGKDISHMKGGKK